MRTSNIQYNNLRNLILLSVGASDLRLSIFTEIGFRVSGASKSQ